MGARDRPNTGVTTSGGRPRWPGADLPGRRIFVAVPLPPEARDAVARLVDEIREAGVPGGGRDVRWVRLDGLHLTLRFIGPTPDERIGPAVDAVRGAAASTARFDAVIGGAGVFPAHGRPRALWLGLREGAETLTDLAEAVDTALADAGWAFDRKPFTAHLTLARSDGVAAAGAIGAHLVAAAAELEIPFRVERMGVFESLTGGGPARYEPLDMVELGYHPQDAGAVPGPRRSGGSDRP
ncbi:MAG: RNA 2',3'-cyclic phosphodiesterase [Chloroflexota bacterium]